MTLKGCNIPNFKVNGMILHVVASLDIALQMICILDIALQMICLALQIICLMMRISVSVYVA